MGKRHAAVKKCLSGFTLIEIIIAIALIAIVMVGMLSAYFQGYVGVIAAGNKGKSVYQAGTNMENQLAVPSGTPVEVTIQLELEHPFTDPNEMQVTGYQITASSTQTGKTSSVVTFVPK